LQAASSLSGFAKVTASNLSVNYFGRKWQLFGRQRAKIGFASARGP